MTGFTKSGICRRESGGKMMSDFWQSEISVQVTDLWWSNKKTTSGAFNNTEMKAE